MICMVLDLLRCLKNTIASTSVPDPNPEPSIILLSSSKNSKKNLDSYFVTSFGLYIFKNQGNVPLKSNKQKNFFLNFSFWFAF